ncbi:hypothetical protein LINGRAHAP2_LOCUS24041 [Linum grandiflorum]
MNWVRIRRETRLMS